MAGALDGIRILDTTSLYSGPLATMILGDQGADVVKIEMPGGHGDLMRVSGLTRGGIAATFHAVNRNKRSLVLDLRDERGVTVLKDLAASADAFVENYRPGVAQRLGIDEPALRAIRPDIVYVSITAWGESGPMAQRPAFDSIVQSMSGFAASQADSSGEPKLIHNALVDKVTGLHAAQAITAALLARERGAGGQHVKLNMLDAGVAFLWLDVMQHRTFIGDEQPKKNSWLRLMRTRDGFLMISVVRDSMFQAAAHALGSEDLASDPRFVEAATRMTHLADLCDEFEKRIEHRSTSEVCEKLAAADVPHAPVTALEDVEALEQVIHNESVREFDHSVSGRIRQAAPVAAFGATPASVRRLAPTLGEHSREVLLELGRSKREVDALIDAGVVE